MVSPNEVDSVIGIETVAAPVMIAIANPNEADGVIGIETVITVATLQYATIQMKQTAL